MSYVDNVLQPGERVVVRATIHWVTYLAGLLALIAAAAVWLAGLNASSGVKLVTGTVALLLAAVGLYALIRAWLRRWGTEIAVTDRRVIYKSGVISRRTIEMNMQQIESVDVDQTLFGRILDYGDIGVHGTGGDVDPFRLIAHPLAIRTAITAR
jgi:uncharacterized membrane protein YdbT with pleckstrin-like domain